MNNGGWVQWGFVQDVSHKLLSKKWGSESAFGTETIKDINIRYVGMWAGHDFLPPDNRAYSNRLVQDIHIHGLVIRVNK